jgi:hypothetical protein
LGAEPYDSSIENHARRADRIVAETNNGGDLVEATLRQVDTSASFRQVWASRGKVIRAEPVSALYEQGRVHHVGAFQQLEDRMCAFTVDFDRKTMGYSPDRLDALVWALTQLMVEGEPENRPLFTSIAMGSGRVRLPPGTGCTDGHDAMPAPTRFAERGSGGPATHLRNS